MAGAVVSLKRLEALKFEFGQHAADSKLKCLRALTRAELHEVVCFIQAWPDNADVLRQADEILARFHRRRDLKQHADELAGTGIAGTCTHFSFYAQTAKWLADRWPDRLQIDWESFENSANLERYLTLLATFSETPALDNIGFELREWIDRLKGPDATDAAFVITRLAELAGDDFLFECIYDQLELSLSLPLAPDTPNRSCAKHDKSPICYQTAPLARNRPSVAEEVSRPPQPPVLLKRATAIRMIDLARSTMATRHRDLDAFAYADRDDVSLIDDQDGLQFVLYGMLPHRRFLLETQYGFLVLKNGVPVSYGSVVSLFGSAEVAYTIFDTFRGGESAKMYVRSLAMAAEVFDCDTFMVGPYQLGEDNQDALASGAWWFYQKLGYRPRDPDLTRLMEQELAKMQRRSGHRTTITTLAKLATDNIYLHLDGQRDDVLGMLALENIGLKISDLLAEDYGVNRDQGEKDLADKAAKQLGLRNFNGWSKGEKLAWRRWAPLVALLPSLENWTSAERRALTQVIRAKGGTQELQFLHRFNAHDRLRASLAEMAQA